MKCKRVLTAVMFIALAFCLVTTTVPTDSDAESTSSTFNVVDDESLSTALDADVNTIYIEINTSEVKLQISAWNEPYYLGGESTTKIVIDGNGNTIDFVQNNSDWNYIRCTNEDCELVLKNVNITNSGYNDGPWNRHDIRFYNKVTLENVVSDKAIALLNDSTLKNVTITDDFGSVYLLWIAANGSNISIQNCTLGSEELTNDTRGIAIKDEYLGDEEISLVTLSISNTKIFTKNTEKPAILVTSMKGADITIRNLDTTGVASGEDNVVALDDKYDSEIASTIPLAVEIITDGAYDAEDGVLDEGTMDMIFGMWNPRNLPASPISP